IAIRPPRHSSFQFSCFHAPVIALSSNPRIYTVLFFGKRPCLGLDSGFLHGKDGISVSGIALTGRAARQDRHGYWLNGRN
ncbi:MAG: hypothetical protein AAAC47_00730, partial [Pararhizobium sp.]